MRIGARRKVKKNLAHSETGALWLADLTVEILEIDPGERWESDIVKVRAENSCGKPEDVWMDPRDFTEKDQSLYIKDY